MTLQFERQMKDVCVFIGAMTPPDAGPHRSTASTTADESVTLLWCKWELNYAFMPSCAMHTAKIITPLKKVISYMLPTAHPCVLYHSLYCISNFTHLP